MGTRIGHVTWDKTNDGYRDRSHSYVLRKIGRAWDIVFRGKFVGWGDNLTHAKATVEAHAVARCQQPTLVTRGRVYGRCWKPILDEEDLFCADCRKMAGGAPNP